MALIKCPKCGMSLADDCVVVWKCNECGKAVKLNLAKLHKIQELKKQKRDKHLLKCSACESPLDDGNEKILCKCSSCGNVIGGNLEYFDSDDLEDKIIEATLIHIDDTVKENADLTSFIYCPECGKKILSDSRICSYCGYPLEDTEEKTNLIKCPECGREISNTATNCPNCGYPIKNIFREVKEKQQEEISQKQKKEFKKKTLSLIKSRKIQVPVIALAILVLVIVLFYKVTHIEVIHGVTWGMSLAEVENKESKYSGNLGYYDEDNGYYAVSNVDYLGENVTLMYIFEDEKLASIWIVPTHGSYKNVYNMALEICKEDGLPVSFEDNTDDEYAPRSRLKWNIKGTTIDIIGNYTSKYSAEYYFSLKPYDGKEFGNKYEDRGICHVGSKSVFPCRNEITPWCEVSEYGGYCYEHGCYVIGCPNGFANVHDKESLCLKHHFLCE